MKSKTGAKNQSIGAVQQHYTTDSVTSKDDTTIGYRQLGHGPGVVILHGSMSTGCNHLQLAELLADTFTVYLPDRRGFGLSSYDKEHTLQNDVEDLEALLARTGTHNVLGVSAGNIISLKAALPLLDCQSQLNHIKFLRCVVKGLELSLVIVKHLHPPQVRCESNPRSHYISKPCDSFIVGWLGVCYVQPIHCQPSACCDLLKNFCKVFF